MELQIFLYSLCLKLYLNNNRYLNEMPLMH